MCQTRALHGVIGENEGAINRYALSKSGPPRCYRHRGGQNHDSRYEDDIMATTLTAAGQIVFVIIGGLLGLIMIVIVVGAYMLPTVYASINGRRDVASIAIVNLLLGWCFPVWVGLLAWAFLPTRR